MSIRLRGIYGAVAGLALTALMALSSSDGRFGDDVAAAEPARHASTSTTVVSRPAAVTGTVAPRAPGARAVRLPKRAPAPTSTPTPASAPRTDRLPTTTARVLPPMIRLQARQGDAGADAALRKQVLRHAGLLLAPPARRDIERGRAEATALHLLLRSAEAGGPLLVFEARGRTVRLQATTHRQTRRTLLALGGLEGRARPAELRLQATPPDFADARTGPRERRSSGALGLAAARLATRYLGVPYVWGGASPRGVDCSGLTMIVYGELGVALDHYAAFQWLEGERIAVDALRPGDLVFFNMKSDGPGHMGLYLGGDRFIHAPRTGDVVKVSVLSERSASYVGAVRPY